MFSSKRTNKEIERLRTENQSLNEQVKQLVRAERRLSVSQQRLDREVQRVEVLNRFSLDARRTENPAQIVALAIDLFFSIFPYEQAVGFLLKENTSLYEPVVLKAVQGLECKEKEFQLAEHASTLIEDLPSSPDTGTTEQLRKSYPGLTPFLEVLRSYFSTEAMQTIPLRAMLLVVPVFIEGGKKLQGLLLLRRITPGVSFLDQLPDEKDFPFLRLIGTHLTQALENVRLYREAQKAIQVRDEFLSIASHELRTPITPLKNELQLIQLLARKNILASYPRDQLLKLVNIADRELVRLTRLIEGMLEVTRMTSGSFSLRMEQVGIGQLIREMVDRFQRQIAETGSMITLELKDTEPGTWDRLRIEQVITNLVTNAIRYGSGNPITISSETSQGRAIVNVEDHGIGISAESQAKLFRKFATLVSNRHFGGLGLGLYISRQIVEAHGGTIHVKSAPGLGTTFTIELPLKPAIAEAQRQAAA